MRTGERGEDQVAAPRDTLWDRHLVRVLDRAADLVHIGEIDLRVNTLAEHVHAQRDEVDVTGALTVTEQAAFDAVRASHVAQLRRGDARSAVVVRVEREDDGFAVLEIAVHPLDRVGVHVRGCHLDRCREVDDDRVIRCCTELFDDLVNDAACELELGARVGLRRVLVDDLGVTRHLLFVLLAQASARQRDIDDAVLILAEHDAALKDRGRVVEVHDRAVNAVEGFKSALDEVLARLRQNLDRDVFRDQVVIDQMADEIKVGLRSGRETNLDLLETHLNQQLKQLEFAVGVHRVDERLVTVAQVDCAPTRCLSDLLVRPRTVRQVNSDLLMERDVLVDWHAGWLLKILHGLAPVDNVGATAGRESFRNKRLRDEIRPKR